MPTYASSTDVSARLGRALTADETTLVATRLEDVERLILHRIPDLADKITAGDVNVEIVQMVEANAVVRVLKNPDGYFSETDGNYSYQYSREAASGQLDILENEWALLGASGGVFMIDVRPRTPYERLCPQLQADYLAQCDPMYDIPGEH